MTPPLLQGSLPLAVALHIQQGLLSVVSLLLLSMLAGMFVCSGWALVRLVRNQPVLPRPPFFRLEPAVWGPGTIVTVIALYLVTSLAANLACRDLLGIRVDEALRVYRGEAAEKSEDKSAPTATPSATAGAEDDAASPANETAAPTKPVSKEPRVGTDENPQETAAAARDLMTLNACHVVLFLVAFPWFFRRCSRVGLEALGLRAHQWPEQMIVGLGTALIAIPAVYFVQFLAVHVFRPESHPVEKMMRDHFSPSTALLAFASAVVLAPIVEETLFRGVLQGWLSQVFRNPYKSSDELSEGGTGDVCWPAVVLTSALFAALHSPQWPAPIPLFFFAMILGMVYQRTGSLLTAITTHGVFNAFSTLMMLAQQLGGDLRNVEDAIPAPVEAVWSLGGWILEILS